MEIFNVEADVKAYLYQQLAELEPLLPPLSALTISVRKSESQKPMHSVELRVDIAEECIVAIGRSRDIYWAIGKAKTKMRDLLNGLQNALVNVRERENTVRQILQGETTRH